MVEGIKLNVVDGLVSWQAPSTDSLGTSGGGRKRIALALWGPRRPSYQPAIL